MVERHIIGHATTFRRSATLVRQGDRRSISTQKRLELVCVAPHAWRKVGDRISPVDKTAFHRAPVPLL
jgi:hypothetical protein